MSTVCDVLRQGLATQVEGIIQGFPARCEKLLQARTALEADRPCSLSQEVPSTLAVAFDVLDGEVHGAARDVRDIAAYVRLRMPLHEDGNNFYVDMQDGIAKTCEDAAGAIAGLADLRVQFLEKRAELKDKVSPSVSQDTQETTTSTKTTEVGKETEEKKKDETWTKTEKKTHVAEAVPERKEALLRLDQAWHGKVVRALSMVTYELARAVDLASKNASKIVDPRGEGRGSKQGAMYY